MTQVTQAAAAGDFTTDWFTARAGEIEASLARAGEVRDLLEIGSWEGRSAAWFLDRFPGARVTCVDTFLGGQEHAHGECARALPKVKRRFLANVVEKYGDRVRVLEGDSREVLFGLRAGTFDAAYVDGCHEAHVALSDIVNSFNLLREGGVLLMDDYLGGSAASANSREDFLRESPRAAIDAFLDLYRGKYEVLHSGYQVHVRKTAGPGPGTSTEAPQTGPRVVIAATHFSQCTGYARVGFGLANGLASRGARVTYFGYQNVPAGAGADKRVLDPSVRVVDVAAETGQPLGFGFDLLPVELQRRPADLVVVYNDVLVVNAFLDAMDAHAARDGSWARPRVAVYMDLVHEDESAKWVRTIDARCDAFWVFSECWRAHLSERYGVSPSKIAVVPHALDPVFREVPKLEARARLGIPADAFVVLNNNRNSYRKALDVSVRAFLSAWKRAGTPPDLALFLNCDHSCETGYDVGELVAKEGARLGLGKEDLRRALERHVLGFARSGFVPDDAVNDLYNACDVGLNTCTGEGFGLCNMEHASLGRPQVVNATGALRDLFGREALPPAERLELCRGFVAHGGQLEVPDSRLFADRLLELYRARLELPRRADAVRARVFRAKFEPEAVLDAAMAGIALALGSPRA